MTLPEEPLDTEAPVEDVLEQRQEVDDPAAGFDTEVPIEADPSDVAEQQAVVDLGDPDEVQG
ncbi:hypothetical protein LWP59_21620 [Amycolatopsis acidiphila]|uniref:Uncharacterized protein n=1 Tax=Amycolatopsis acidiphila TaxID=715473 RepID=A0A558A578_9PSEU|nr:hypothetical protein [Amycolatopsis acidiphila]TVT19417.1 hypothetical protein FNH06_24350 [Amycolatopsis acidiphila]UIJ56772.1 hypothetical protein LWP59_21620 [Amycolatopsis acidiphila]GHG55210.1 hypothetical protein GCM10017788_05580 [Amycolatopsis acidiphila]